MLDLKFSFSEYYLNPALGLNLANFLKLHFGYSIPMNDMNGIRIKGPTIGLVFTFGTGGYYLRLSN